MYLKFNLYIPPLYVRYNRNILTNRNFRHIPSPYPLDEQTKFLIKILNILNKAWHDWASNTCMCRFDKKIEKPSSKPKEVWAAQLKWVQNGSCALLCQIVSYDRPLQCIQPFSGPNCAVENLEAKSC